jgi:uncharacterized membrane protein
MRGRAHTLTNAVDIALLVFYPVIVFVGLRYVGVRTTALVLFLFMGRRFISMILSSRSTSMPVLVQAALIAAIQGAAAATGSALALRASPFVISLSFVVHFALSLRTTPLVETFARLERPDLPEEHVAYCRRLTEVWIVVLSLNSVMLLVATLVEDEAIWAILVGPVSYGIIGLTFAVEYAYRKWRFQEFRRNSAIDRLLKPVLGRGA